MAKLNKIIKDALIKRVLEYKRNIKNKGGVLTNEDKRWLERLKVIDDFAQGSSKHSVENVSKELSIFISLFDTTQAKKVAVNTIFLVLVDYEYMKNDQPRPKRSRTMSSFITHLNQHPNTFELALG